MDCQQITDQLEAYALGALDPDEAARVEAHLAGCPGCRRLAAEYRDIANALPLALAAAVPLRPPPSVRDRVLGALETAAPTTPVLPKPLHTVGGEPLVPGGRSHEARRWLPPTAWPALSRRRLRMLGALAAVLALALSLAWSARLSVTLAQERALRAEYADLVGQQEVVLEVVDSPKTIKALLRPPPGSSSTAYGKLYTRPDLPHVVAMAARLPQPPEGHAYHLWLTRQGQTALAGVLAVNNQGFGLLVFDADSNGPVYEAARLTRQPEGATAPTEPPVIQWSK